MSVYTKIVLITTTLLWMMGTLLFWLSERNTSTFEYLSYTEQFINYFMLSVTVRSSGFSNIDFTHLSSSSIILAQCLIFIGASSGSTGGGIKVSTFAVLVITIIRFFQGKKPVVFNRTITTRTVQRAFLIFTVAIIFTVIGTFALSLTETLQDGMGIEYLVTEVISALGAVGLSMGLTPHLSTAGRVIVIVLMLIGRVGVLTFLWSIIGDHKESRLNYPETTLLVG